QTVTRVKRAPFDETVSTIYLTAYPLFPGTRDMIFVKRAYEPARKNDGRRFLVDRLWPRGVTKESLQVERWMKTTAPGNELRKWFNHDPEKWAEFQRRYFAELDQNPAGWQSLVEAARAG